jgi:hypothetical protein
MSCTTCQNLTGAYCSQIHGELSSPDTATCTHYTPRAEYKTRNGRIETAIDCYHAVAAEVLKRRLRRAGMHYQIQAGVIRARIDGTCLVINRGSGMRPDMFSALLDYAQSPDADY